MVILDEAESERTVGCHDRFLPVFLLSHHCADCIDIFNDNVCLLVYCLEKAEFVFIRLD